jgi:hypothetical protein
MAVKLEIEKRVDEIKKKCSPLKLLRQSQPNFAEMIIEWSTLEWGHAKTIPSKFGWN